MRDIQLELDLNDVKLYKTATHTLVGADTIKTYCMGGSAAVTLISPTGIYHTYHFYAKKDEDLSDLVDDGLCVYVRIRSGQWVLIGAIQNNGTQFHWYTKSLFEIDTPEVRGARFIVKMMNHDFTTPMILQHEGCCSACGRKLIHPVSIERGIGPRCYKRVHHD